MVVVMLVVPGVAGVAGIAVQQPQQLVQVDYSRVLLLSSSLLFLSFDS